MIGWKPSATCSSGMSELDSGTPPRDRTLRLCLAAESFYPVYAGPAVRFRRYLPGLLERGIDVRVFTATPGRVKASMSGLDDSWSELRPGEMLPVESLDGVPLHRVRVPDTGGRRSLWFGRKLVEFCSGSDYRPDVIQLLSLGMAGVPGVARLRRMGIPTVYTKTMAAELSRRPLKRWAQRHYRGLPLRMVDRIVVSSSVMEERLGRLGISTPIEVIPNGVDLDRFHPPEGPADGADIRASLGVDPDDPLLLFVGPISPRKGIDLLLEAWCELAPRYPRLHLLLVGPRRDEVDPKHHEFHEKLSRLLSASGASDRVHFAGLVENVGEYMRAGDIFVFTSRREGMPNVVPEAMASGLPVVTTRFVGLPKEFGREGEHYLGTGFDPADLAGAVSRLLTDRRLREDLGRSARRWVEERLGVGRSLDRYAALYRELAVRGAHSGVLTS